MAASRNDLDDNDGDATEDEGLISGAGLDENHPSSASYLTRLVAVACLGGLQFGWDTGIASGMLVAIRGDLGHELSEGEQELIVSATTVGAIVGAVVAGRMSDWAGRKKVMIASAVLFLLGSLEQAASQVVRELVLGRVLVGLGVGMASMVVPTYLAEVAPTSVRGRIVGFNSVLITFGQVVAYTIDAALYNVTMGWRWMVLIGGAPAILQMVGLFYLDESPRWLVARGRIVSARRVLQRIYPTATNREVDMEIERIERSMRGTTSQVPEDPDERNGNGSGGGGGGGEDVEGRGSMTRISSVAPQILSTAAPKVKEAKGKLKLLWNEPNNRKALILACGLQFFQQMVGFNSLMYFSGRLLLMAGFTSNPNAAAIGIAVSNCIGTALGMRFVDRIGRRKLLLWATFGTTLSLALLSFSLSMVDVGPTSGTPSATVAASTETAAEGAAGAGAGAWAYLSLIFMIVFTLNYAVGLGILPWLIQSEVFAGPVRDWTSNLVISSTFLHLVKAITPAGSFALYALVAAASWYFTWTRLPDMKGVSLSDVQHSFGPSSSSGSGAAGGTATGAAAAYQAVATTEEDDEDDVDGRRR
ncbi:related to myo-inositol transporter [Pseudozyma flocculosa]|uniref:Related to myo-inositol transporter n=1 Tax=Pseudozyma flocculosa TaxID=84751 RepID=A0A5C3EU19_9BASI|nr:related to myo-inositol transporter [Pseudozyma flocculosa]